MSQTIEQILKESQQALRVTECEALKRRCKAEISIIDFNILLARECQQILYTRGIMKDWVIDEDNAMVVKRLYKYITGAPDFGGSLEKGIMILGSLGSGKTVLLRGFANVIGRLCDKNFRFISAYDLSKLVVEFGTEKYSKLPLLIDDLGKEAEMIKDYGTEVRPLAELFASRYETGALTFCTGNYNMKTYDKKYGEQTVERLLEMFNFIEMTGKTRRK